MNKDYKSGRKPIRLNREIRNLTENEEIENKVWQQIRLVDYLNNFPPDIGLVTPVVVGILILRFKYDLTDKYPKA